MDSPEEQSQTTAKKVFPSAILVSLLTFLSASLLLVDFPFTNPISVYSQCKIVSSSVDLRSSKVCELGLLNYKAKHVLYPSEKKKFRCRYDYYWASVFQVEYEDHTSGQMRFALAEAPNEALPLECRPNFGAAWLTKDKFKVNETYDCWYTSGISKVNIYHGSFFNCQAKEPSSLEMFKRYSILCTRIFGSLFSGRERYNFCRWEMIAGVVTGFSTSLISISLVKLLQHTKCRLPQFSRQGMLSLITRAAYLRRACFFVAYFSFMGWLAIQCWKRLGFQQIYALHKY